MSKFLDIALKTASEGYPVFPLKPKMKTPIYDRGFKIATRDEAQIRAWWAERPDANIGVPTGAVSGISVIDVDGPQGVESIKGTLGSLPETRVHRTPHGHHHIYKYDALFHNGVDLLPKVDIRTDGGYIVWVGSFVDCTKDESYGCTKHDSEYRLA